ncbi:MAG: hypothetical protein L0213_12405 [Candidatus Dadabacteria bacterium]|nr:hypothetical protein [Candidatus Dadabacteria bacterium]
MPKYLESKSIKSAVVSVMMLLAVIFGAGGSYAADRVTSQPFTGAKVNGGTVTLTKDGGKTVLTLSDDFVVPGTPDPHWQVVDSKGNVYLLERLPIKGDKINTTITLPSYIPDVAKVQIWCAFAESLLGEAPFAPPAN